MPNIEALMPSVRVNNLNQQQQPILRTITLPFVQFYYTVSFNETINPHLKECILLNY